MTDEIVGIIFDSKSGDGILRFKIDDTITEVHILLKRIRELLYAGQEDDAYDLVLQALELMEGESK
jgi:hypothetical protein